MTGVPPTSDAGPLAGRVALVAGATRGASRAIALELVRAGATVVATGRSSREHGPSELGRPGPLLARTPGALVVELTDGPSEDSRAYRSQVDLLSDLTKAAAERLGLELTQHYDVDDVDGSRPDAWRDVVEVQDRGLPADVTEHR